jgi:hypothetical protein
VASNLGNFATVRACSAREFEELLRASANECKLRAHSRLQIVWSSPNTASSKQFKDEADVPCFDPLARTDSKG